MDLLNEINTKYMELEAEADRKLENAKCEEEKLMKMEAKIAEHTSTQQSQKMLSYEEAINRNANLLKAVDMAKARLRSRSTFSPIEPILEKAIENYKRDVLETLSARQTSQHIRSSDGEHFHDVENNIYEVLQ